MRFDSGDAARLRELLSDCASAYETGNPFDASATAGAMLSAHVRLPYFVCAISKPRTLPGTPDDRHPSMLSFVGLPLGSRYMSCDAFSGARSRKSMNVARPSARRISM